MACIIKELLKLGEEFKSISPEHVQDVEKVMGRLRFVAEIAESADVTTVDNTELDPQKSKSDDDGKTIGFIYKGKRYGTLAKAIDSWLKYDANSRDSGRSAMNIVNELKDMIGTYIGKNPEAKAMFKKPGRYFVVEGSKWTNSGYFEDAINSMKYDQLAADGKTGGPFEVSSIGGEMGKKFSALNAKITVDGKKRAIEDVFQTDVKGYTTWREGKGKPPINKGINIQREYARLWMGYAVENPDLYNSLFDAVTENDLELVDTFATTGGVNQAHTLQVLIGTGWRPKVKAIAQAEELARPKTVKEQAEVDQDKLEGCF